MNIHPNLNISEKSLSDILVSILGVCGIKANSLSYFITPNLLIYCRGRRSVPSTLYETHFIMKTSFSKPGPGILLAGIICKKQALEPQLARGGQGLNRLLKIFYSFLFFCFY
jgi:hypothetical protein